MNQSELTGSWRLKSFEIESPEGIKSDWGRNTHGLLIYAADGYMSVSINKDIQKQSENEMEDLFDSLLFYAGTYVIQDNLIRHQVTEASNPARVGKEMIRYAEFENNLIKLSTPKESFGRAILTWEKVKKS